jgi:hypothetical protein
MSSTDKESVLRRIFTPQYLAHTLEDGSSFTVTSLGPQDRSDYSDIQVRLIESLPRSPKYNYSDVKTAMKPVRRAAEKLGPSNEPSFWTRQHPVLEDPAYAGKLAVYQVDWFGPGTEPPESEGESTYCSSVAVDDAQPDVEEEEEDGYVNIISSSGIKSMSDSNDRWRFVSLQPETAHIHPPEVREMSQVASRVTDLMSTTSSQDIAELVFVVRREDGSMATYKWQ